MQDIQNLEGIAKEVGFQLLRASSLGLRMRTKVNYNEKDGLADECRGKSDSSAKDQDKYGFKLQSQDSLGEGCAQDDFEDDENSPEGGIAQDEEDDYEDSAESLNLCENSGSCNSGYNIVNRHPTAFKRIVPIKPKPQIGYYNPLVISPKKHGILTSRLGYHPLHLNARAASR